MKLTSTIIALAGLASVASASLTITEVFAGLSGEDGTQDWIEVTNYTGATIDTGSFWYDDSNPLLANAGQLDSIMLGAGQSAIFLVSSDGIAVDSDTYASAIAEFNAIWSYTGFIGLTNGGGSLGQGSDSANILDSIGMVLSSAEYASSDSLSTLDYVSGSATESILGVNGAYSSNPFFNDNLGLPGDQAILIGSPGTVPTPGSIALVGLGGLVGFRRRR